MNENIIHIKKSSNIPILGIDFLGIVDRGTNVIELKPLTLCNLKCRYCFVSAGDYTNNFILQADYILEKVKEIVDFKGSSEIEIHIAPYGESLLYPEIYYLIKNLWRINGIETISMQTNGLLLTDQIIQKLEDVKLTRINISLNTLEKKKAEYLCNYKKYDMETLKTNIELLIQSNINILLAPVWFPKENDEDIEDIIKFVNNYYQSGISENKIRIGIQKYLIYKTGRKLKKIRTKSWGHFYKQLSDLEKKYKTKLKLGPNDFDIHKRKLYNSVKFTKGQEIQVEIVSKGRWSYEVIARIEKSFGIKVLLEKPLLFSDQLAGKKVSVKIIKANYRDNLITALLRL
ncbi:MAG: radical SAM protein [Promethearchaeota archaeon]